jgi:hypothetical protein
MKDEWTYALSRPATESYRLCWCDTTRGRYVIHANVPAPGSFRAWFTTLSGAEIYLGDRSSRRDALALCEADRSWGLERP